jgi:DNA-binding NarL/FixJ family response regulator
MMGGDVTVTSELGKGFRLPASADSQVKSSIGADGRHSPIADRVLVIDDDATARELIADHLKAEGFSVATAAGGLEGLKLAKELRPTAITLNKFRLKHAEELLALFEETRGCPARTTDELARWLDSVGDDLADDIAREIAEEAGRKAGRETAKKNGREAYEEASDRAYERAYERVLESLKKARRQDHP